MKPQHTSFAFLFFFSVFVSVLIFDPLSLQTKQPKKNKIKSAKTITAKTGRALLDSLLNELPLKAEIKDTNYVNFLNQISTEYLDIDPNKGLKMAEKALSVSRSIKNRQLESYSIYCYGRCLLSLFRYNESVEYFEMGLQIAEELGNQPYMQKFYSALGWALVGMKDYKKGIDFYEKGYELARKTNDKKNISGKLHNIGDAFIRLRITVKPWTTMKKLSLTPGK
jgi:tetratricopeptide (TPR) repeat protein